MGSAKELIVKVIPSKIAVPFVKTHHYSGKVVNNSNLHFGVFYHGRLHGVMSFGPSLDKSKIQGLVEGTKWSEFIELNRMAFDDVLPRNSESRAISIAIRLIKKKRSTNQMDNLLCGWLLVRRWYNLPRKRISADGDKTQQQPCTITQRKENPQNDP